MKKMWDLAWPVMILGLARVAMRTTDVLVVGFLGSWAVAAVGLGDVWMRLLLFLGLGLGTGTLARIAEGIGAEKQRQVDQAMTQSVLIALILGGVATGVIWVASSDMIRLLGARPRLVNHAGQYLQLVGLSSAPRLLYLVAFRGMAGAGDTRTPVFIGVCTTLINIALTVVFVFGFLGMPRMGVLGAGMGTAAGNFIAGFCCLALLLHPGYPVSFRPRGWFNPAEAWSVVRIGFPRVLTGGIQALADLPLSGILLWFGAEAVAAYQIAIRILMLAMMPNWGIGTAAGSFTGRYLGAGRWKKGRRQGWVAVKLSLLLTAPLALILGLLSRPVALLFIREEPTLTLTAQFIVVFAVSIVVLGFQRSLASALEGAGQTLLPLAATTLGLGVLLGGSGWLCGRLGFGIEALFAMYITDHLVRGLVVYCWYQFRSWAQIAVRTNP